MDIRRERYIVRRGTFISYPQYTTIMKLTVNTRPYRIYYWNIREEIFLHWFQTSVI